MGIYMGCSSRPDALLSRNSPDLHKKAIYRKQTGLGCTKSRQNRTVHMDKELQVREIIKCYLGRVAW